MEDIVLIIIACCLLFGAEKTKKGIGVILKVIGIGILILIGLSFLGSFLPDTDQTTDVVQEQEEYTVVTVEDLQDAQSASYDYAKEQYNGLKVSVTGRIDTPYKEFGLEMMPYITNIDPSSVTNEKSYIPCMADNDEVDQKLKSFEIDTIINVKGTVWVANHEDMGIEVDTDNPDEFAIVLMIDSVE